MRSHPYVRTTPEYPLQNPVEISRGWQIQRRFQRHWIPAFAGMTMKHESSRTRATLTPTRTDAPQGRDRGCFGGTSGGPWMARNEVHRDVRLRSRRSTPCLGPTLKPKVGAQNVREASPTDWRRTQKKSPAFRGAF